VLLLMPKTSYRAEPFLEAARRLGVDVRVGSDRCKQLAERWGEPLALDFRRPERGAEQALEHARSEPFDAVVATDDRSTRLAALVGQALGLPVNTPDAATAARDKALMRRRLRAADVACPDWRTVDDDAADAALIDAARRLGYPVVVKPLLMSGSRGVQRADDDAQFRAAAALCRRLLRASDVVPCGDPAAHQILIERFVAGREIALEGLVGRTGLTTLAIFDKPDPLDGPIFAETIYVTPSRESEVTLAAVRDVTARACTALGLGFGPVHAELRIGPSGHVVVIEVAGRTIGGLCSKALNFVTGRSLEELVLLAALGRDLPPTELEVRASGVYMLPVPSAGLLRSVGGIDAARRVPGISDVEITAPLDHEVVPLPEGSSYLGFVFARGDEPESVEASLRQAVGRLEFEIVPNLIIRD